MAKVVFYREEININRFRSPETRKFLRALFCAFRASKEGERTGIVLENILQSLDSEFQEENVTKSFLVTNYERYKNKGSVRKAFKLFFITALKKGFYNHDEDIDVRREELLDVSEVIVNWREIIRALSDEDGLAYIRFIKPDYEKSGHWVSVMKFDTPNQFIQELILEFMIRIEARKKFEHRGEVFYKQIGRSLNGKSIRNIYDFDIKALEMQCKYYKTEHNDTQYYLRHFYIFMLDKQAEVKSISIREGITRQFLLEPNFIELFLEGYRYYPMNIFDQVPENDKWMVSPNGTEYKNADDSEYSLKKIDFSIIKDEKLRHGVKSWFWNELGGSFSYKCTRIKKVFEFLAYREHLREMSLDKFLELRWERGLPVKDIILTEEVHLYIKAVKEKYKPETARDKIKGFSGFFKYLEDKEFYKVEKLVYEELEGKSKRNKTENDIVPIEDEDFSKLLKKLEEESHKKLLSMLYYLVFCITRSSNIRTSDVIDLNVDCNKFQLRPGIYSVRLRRKINRDEEKPIQVKKEVSDIIDAVRAYTSEIRDEAPDEVKHYLFLRKAKKGSYKKISGRGYRAHLTECCMACGIPNYSPSNVRKTYYTKLIEESIKNNVSLAALGALTDHKSFDTTDNYYVKTKLLDYLEAMYKCEIDTSIKTPGRLSAQTLNETKDNIVSDGTGICQKTKKCTVLSTAPCLMCNANGFVTSPKHIPDFERIMKEIDYEMENCNDEHTREHYYSYKKVVAKYIYELTLLEGGCSCE